MHQIATVTQTQTKDESYEPSKKRKKTNVCKPKGNKETVGQRCKLLVDENNNVEVKVNKRRNNVTDFNPTLSSSRKNGNVINPNQENNLLPCTPN